MCYKDMTFCDHYESCKDGSKCFRALTPEVQKAAEKWWGSDDAPICMFVGKPKCFKKEKTVRVLTNEGQDLQDEFESMYGDRGCTCFISPPCSYCMHPGNPLNLEESPDLWEDITELFNLFEE